MKLPGFTPRVLDFRGTDAAREAFQALLDEFTKEHPNVKIDNDTMSANDDGFRTKVNTDMNSGNEPDLLFYFIGADAEGFVNAGKVVPLNEISTRTLSGRTASFLMRSSLPSKRTVTFTQPPLTGFYEGLFVNKKSSKKMVWSFQQTGRN